MNQRLSLYFAACLLLFLVIPLTLHAEWIADGTPVCTEDGVQRSVEIVSDGSGGAVIAWQDSRNGDDDIYIQRMDANGNALWTAGGVRVCANIADQVYPIIATDGAGGAIVAWDDARSGGHDIYAQHVSAAGVVQWDIDGVPICTTATDQYRSMSMRPDGAGGAILAWKDFSGGGDPKIYAQRITAAGSVQWGADGTPVCEATGWKYGPGVAPDGSGGAVIIWGDGRGGDRDIYAQRIDAAGVAQWTTDGVFIAYAINISGMDIVSDGAGGAFITWNDRTQWIDAAGVAQWTAGGVTISTMGGSWATIETDQSGGVIIAWQASVGVDEYNMYDIYVQRVASNGLVQWGVDGVAICAADSDQVAPSIVTDGAGGAIITWTDKRVYRFYEDIYAQRISSAGVVQWTTNGKAICTAVGSQFAYDLTSDDSGGAIIVWHDNREFDYLYDIYAQRVDGNGDYSTLTCDVAPTSLDFGTVLVDASSDQTFTITNTGTVPLSGTIGESCSHYSIIANGGAYTLNPAQSLVVTVRFQPASGGTHACTIETGDAACSDVTCTGVGQGPVCQVLPTSIDFGTVPVGVPKDTLFVITNSGGGTLSGAVSEPCSDYTIVSGGGAYTLAAGEFRNVFVRFMPQSNGAHNCTVETGDALCSDVSLAGVGEGPICGVSTSTLNFGYVPVGSTSYQSFTITNTAGGTLAGTVSESCSDYTIVSGAGPYNLTAGQSLPVTVQFSPTVPGQHPCTIETGDALCTDVTTIAIACPLTSRLYVKKTATGAGDGSSWTDAFTELRYALAAACSTVTEIWVAEGTYVPYEGQVSTFPMKSGLALYGGFEGTETSLSQRDIVAHPTVLSGDIGTPGVSADNVYNVVRSEYTDATAVLDGFTVTGGIGPDGGGMCVWGGAATVQNVIFTANSSDNGGGLWSSGAVALSDVTFIGNSSQWDGGGMYCDSTATLSNVVFRSNSAVNHGGGIYLADDVCVVTNGVFQGNSADQGGGLAAVNGALALTNLTFHDNTAATDGGGVYDNDCSGTITNVVLWGDTALGGYGYNEIFSPGALAPTISYSLIAGTGSGWDAAFGNYGGNVIDADPLFVNAGAGDLRLLVGSPAVDTGDNAAPNLPATDFEGNPRIEGTAVDLGAYEVSVCSPPPVVYVDADAVGANDGSSWVDAFTDLQDALAAPVTCLGAEIWVAEGTYMPTVGADRTVSFEMRNGVSLYGGFNGTESAVNERDFDTNVTILSGDIGIPADSTDNIYQIVIADSAVVTGRLDGFTVTGANDDRFLPYGIGAGMFCTGSPTVANVIFDGNTAQLAGAGMACGNPSLTNVTFRNNTVISGSGGAAIYSGSYSNPTLTNVLFENNSSPSDGGALLVCDATLTDVTFRNNSAVGNGGGIFVANGGSVGITVVDARFESNTANAGAGIYFASGPALAHELTNAVFTGNTATTNGGALYVGILAAPVLTNVSFSGNSAGGNGGAMCNAPFSAVSVVNTIMWGDTAGTGNEVYTDANATPVFSYSLIEGSGGSASWNAALGTDGGNNIDDDPLFVDGGGGDLHLSVGSPAINAGNDATPNLPATDLDGNARINGLAVDMGAYEWTLCVPVTRLYVDGAATGANDGSSWVDAFTELRDALAAAEICPNVAEIWVAEGTYRPTAGADRNATFTLLDNLALYGGFAGSESMLSERDLTAHVTFLSGDIGVAANPDDNSYHVVSYGGSLSAMLDGFTISGGNSNYEGGGMVVSSGSVTILNVVFSENSAAQNGGGLYSSGLSATTVNLADVVFVGNTAGDFGGGMHAEDNSVTLTSVTFDNNTSGYIGGGLVIGNTGTELDADLANIVFRGNSADEGGAMAVLSGTLNLTNATFNGNTAASHGGGLFAYEINGTVTITNVILWGNSAPTYPEIITDGLPLVSHSIIAGSGGSGGTWDPNLGNDGGNNIDADPLFVDVSGGDLRLFPSSPAVDAGNNAVSNLPGTDIDGNPRVQNGTVDMGAYEFMALENASINSIKDVPNDQGSWVRIFFTRSRYDDAEETQYPIAQYDVHRRVDNPALVATILSKGQTTEPGTTVSLQDHRGGRYVLRAVETGPRLIRFEERCFVTADEQGYGAPPGLWEVVGNVSAQQQDQYIRLVPTLGDSSDTAVPYTTYYISAHTTTPSVFFDSPVDSGYSIDNIAPGVPQGVAVAYNTGSGNQVSWDASPEPDFQFYRVYRDADEGFAPDPSNRVQETAATTWNDPDYDGWDVCYKVTAVDHAGNESEAGSAGTTTGVTEPAIPGDFALHQNVPNPFNPATQIRFDVPARGGEVDLRVYDVAGRLVRTLVDARLPGGEHTATWDGRNNRGARVASGVYFYRMVAPGFRKTLKMILLQ